MENDGYYCLRNLCDSVLLHYNMVFEFTFSGLQERETRRERERETG